MTRQEALDMWLDHVTTKGLGQCKMEGVNKPCVYYDYHNGNMCAVGTLMTDPMRYANYRGDVDDLISDHGDEVADEGWLSLTSDDYVDGEGSFLMSLQEFHDDSGSWVGTYLNPDGLHQFKKEWGLN